MIISKFQCALAVAVVLATSGGLLWGWQENAQLRQEVDRRKVATDTGTTELKAQVATQARRAAAAEAKLGALLKEAKEAGARAAAQPGPGGTVNTQEILRATLARGKQLAGEGKFQEALEGYLKSYRELQAKRPGSSECQSLMGAIKVLSRTYPQALMSLADLRDAATRQLHARPGTAELVFEIALLNERLGQGSRTLALYDSLPANDHSRPSLAMIAFTSFVDARRYSDALVGKSFGQMLSLIEIGIALAANPPGPSPEAFRKSVIADALTGIEVLTGAGRLDDARVLTEKLFVFDGSEATRAALKERVERAGAGAGR